MNEALAKKNKQIFILSCIGTKACSPFLTAQAQKARRLHKHNIVNYSLAFQLKSGNTFTKFVKLKKNVFQIQIKCTTEGTTLDMLLALNADLSGLSSGQENR